MMLPLEQLPENGGAVADVHEDEIRGARDERKLHRGELLLRDRRGLRR